MQFKTTRLPEDDPLYPRVIAECGALTRSLFEGLHDAHQHAGGEDAIAIALVNMELCAALLDVLAPGRATPSVHN